MHNLQRIPGENVHLLSWSIGLCDGFVFFIRNALLVNNVSLVISKSHALQAICSLSFISLLITFSYCGDFGIELYQKLLFVWTSQVWLSSIQWLSCIRLCDPMDCSMTGLSVHHQPPEFTHPCPLSRWCHLTISSSVVPFSSCPQSFPESGSFRISQFFASGGQSIGVSASASVLPMNIQDWFPLGWTGWISLQSKGLARVFSNTTDLNWRR